MCLFFYQILTVQILFFFKGVENVNSSTSVEMTTKEKQGDCRKSFVETMTSKSARMIENK